MTQYTYLPDKSSSRRGGGTLTRSSLPRAASCLAVSLTGGVALPAAGFFPGFAAFTGFTDFTGLVCLTGGFLVAVLAIFGFPPAGYDRFLDARGCERSPSLSLFGRGW